LTARSQRENGALVESLRTYLGSRLNAHVARFVVWGNDAEYQSRNSDGISYLRPLLKVAGKILLGSDHDNVTSCITSSVSPNFPAGVARYSVPVE
jgi:hypothetical protein